MYKIFFKLKKKKKKKENKTKKIIWLHPTACGILVSQFRIQFTPPSLQAWSLNHWTTREAAE